MRTLVPDVGTVAAATEATPQVATTVVVRGGGLPVAALDDLAAAETMRCLRGAGELERRAEAVAGELGDDLYRIVPSLEDRAERRAAIGLRRDIHNGRWSASTERAVASVLPRLPAAQANRLRHWSESAGGRHRLLTAATDAFPGELRGAAEAMCARLRTPAIASGLALASPEFTVRLLSGASPSGPDSRFARSATAYLTRIAVKTSPFSSLTTVGVARYVQPPDGGRQPQPARRSGTAPLRDVSSSRSLAVALLLACAQTPQAAGLVEVVGVDGIRGFDGRRLATLPARTVHNGMGFRVDELTDCGLYDWLLDALPGQPVLLDRLTGPEGLLGEAGPHLARRLLSIGLIQPVLPWEASTSRDFGALARWTRARVASAKAMEPGPAAPPAPVREFAAAVDRLAAQEDIVAETSDAAVRTAAITAARSAAEAAFSSLGRPVPPWLAALPLFHEVDASAQPAAPVLPAAVAEDLAEAGRWLAPLTVRHPYYDAMVRRFVGRHGIGARGVDLLEFLYGCLDVADVTPAALRPAPVDPQLAQDPHRLRGRGTLGHATHAIFYQLAAPDAEHLARGAYDMVVNLVHAGATGLIGRWTSVPGLHDAMGTELAEWVRGRHPGCTVHQVSAAADWADLQRPGLRTLSRLRCPGDLLDSAPATELTGMTLAHDPASATLQAYDREGGPVAFAYLGAVPQHLLSGPTQLLCLLSDPWITVGRVDRDRRVFDDLPHGDSPGPAFQPRVRQGRIVWARARWSFAADDVPSPRPQESPVDFLGRVLAWKTRHELPDEVYVTRITRGRTGVTKEKPQWLGFEHPYAIGAVLGHLPDGVTAIDVSEALPGRGEHWACDADGEAIATEFIGMVRHG